MHPQNMQIKNPAAILPPALARSCSIANYRQGKIVVFAPNGAVAAKLNLLRPTLLDRLSKRGAEITGLDIRVQPRPDESQPVEKENKLTDEAALELDRLHKQLPDSELKVAVGRILRRNRA